jgi:hypothetical protein
MLLYYLCIERTVSCFIGLFRRSVSCFCFIGLLFYRTVLNLEHYAKWSAPPRRLPAPHLPTLWGRQSGGAGHGTRARSLFYRTAALSDCCCVGLLKLLARGACTCVPGAMSCFCATLIAF